ncbi:hypothetical protein F4779DRAFT_347414 [Xylariaceae sp. FL0662B]|nr:hypothetical protein F4779DRAFT_347414 [Xylariaceae sp. FL0662B]
MAEAYCASTIANLEGLKDIELPAGDELLRPTLEALDRRTRRLENIERITPPPPMLDPSWDSLTWRICRLTRRQTLRPVPRLTPPYINASLGLLKSTIATITAPARLVWPEKEDLEETAVLGLAAQWLCYVAGQRLIRVHNLTTELTPICFLALDLSLEGESRVTGPGWRGVAQPPPNPVIHTAPPKAGHCVYCSCSCHEVRPLRRRASSVSSDSSWRDRRGAKKSVVGWFKKLAFWRRKRIVDDASSTTGTIFSK